MEPRADLLAPVLYGGEALPEVQSPVAYLSRTTIEAHGDATLAPEPPHAAHEFVTGHDIRTDMYEARRPPNW